MRPRPLFASSLTTLAAQVVDTRLPPRFTPAEAERASRLAESMSARIVARFTPADILEHGSDLQRIVLGLSMAGAVQIMAAIDAVRPGSLAEMPALRAHLALLNTLLRLAEMFRIDRLRLFVASLRRDAARNHA